MKELVIISGKGGTGKTSLVASLATLSSKSEKWSPVFVDCDVDAADLHLIFNPDVDYKEDFYSGKSAVLHSEKCVKCNKCYELCKFDAINVSEDGSIEIDKIKCEGCGVCAKFCPAEAIEMRTNLAGEWYESSTRFGKLIHAKLGIAEENSGKLVTKIRNHARLVANRGENDLIVVDGSPGIGCPVIASISGANMVLIVTEPTVSGLHDLQRVFKLTKHFKINCSVCINKFDINDAVSDDIEKYCSDNGIDLVGKIPYDKAFTDAQILQKSLVEFSDGNAANEMKQIWDKISNTLENN